MNLHTATLPNGKTVTRNSATRVYTHAVAVVEKIWDKTAQVYMANENTTDWKVLSFHGSMAAAYNAAKVASHWAEFQATMVVPVTMVVKGGAR